MKTIIAIIVLFASIAIAQTCIVPAPATPPTPTVIVGTLPVDGGTVGCTIRAVAPGGTSGGAPQDYAVGNAKCATMVQMAKQAMANDNGWNDGGAP